MYKKISLVVLFIVLIAAVVTVTLPRMIGHAANTNLIANPSLEIADATGTTPQNWQHQAWGTNTATFSYLNSGENGTRSVAVHVTSYTDGDAKWYFNTVSVMPNTVYVFSDYYIASVPTSLVAWVIDTAGKDHYIDLGTVAASAQWKNVQATVTTPANAQKMTIFHLINHIGILQTDNYSLQVTSTTPVVINHIPNNSMEQVSPASPSQPLAWTSNHWGNNTAQFSYLNTGFTGSRSVKTQITSYTDGDAKWYYTPQPSAAGVTYKFTDYFEANITSKIVVMVNKTDGTTQYLSLRNADPASTWTQYSDTFTTPAGTQTISVFHLIAAVGYLITDEYALTPYTPVGFNRGLVSLTFDDGWQSQYTNALPLLNTYHDKATFYLCPDFFNTPNYMTMNQATTVQQAGNEIASHTMNHPDLTGLDSSALNFQLSQSRQFLQQNFGTTITDFATPYGAYNRQVVGAIQQYYGSHRSTDIGYNSKDNFNVYNIRTQVVLSTTSVSDVNGWIQTAMQDRVWLVLVFHQVDTSGNQYSITPANLDAILASINSKGLPVETIQQASNEIKPQVA